MKQIRETLRSSDSSQLITAGVESAKSISAEEVKAIVSLVSKLGKAIALIVVGAAVRTFQNGSELSQPTHPEFDEDYLNPNQAVEVIEEYDGSDINPGATCVGDSCTL